MWIFGYGSLMWDGWENSRGCLHRAKADLAGFRRIFNKASVKRWGTKECPAPTLNLEANLSASCRGIAFEFPDQKREEVIQYLKEREGKNFELLEHGIQLENGQETTASILIYAGKNLIKGQSLWELVAMAHGAVGTEGSGLYYVRGVVNKLSELSIEDPHVAEFWQTIKQMHD